MVNEIEKNSKVILKYIQNEKHVTISEMAREPKLSRGQIRIAVAFLLGAVRIDETKVGMAKVYNTKWINKK